jgi:phosphohistidine phosphatase SixA
MIVFVLRHADRETDPADDLTVAGRERADVLAKMLADSRVSVAYRSEFMRTRRTLEPLERKFSNLTVEEIRLGNMAADVYARKVVEAVKSQPANAVVVVVSHSDTVGPIVEGLGGEHIEPISSGEFDKLFVLFVDSATGTATSLKLRYGAAT